MESRCSWAKAPLPLIFVSLLICCGWLIGTSLGKSQYVEPLNMGMKVTIPYDIANLFNQFPIQGTLSVFLSLALASILFFGVITSPFGYMFGIPSEKYVLGDLKGTFTQDPPNPLYDQGPLTSNINLHPFQTTFDRNSYNMELDGAPRTFDTFSDIGPRYWNQTLGPDEAMSISSISSMSFESWGTLPDLLWERLGRFQNPDLLESLFYWMPQSGSVGSKECQLLVICSAHAVLKRLPIKLISIYRLFSRGLMGLPKEYRRGVVEGLSKGESGCNKSYAHSCPENPFTLTLKAFLNLLPFKPNANGLPIRKQAMYI